MINNAFKVKNGLIVDGNTEVNGYIEFNTGYTATAAPARVYYDNTENALSYFPTTPNMDVTLNIGQENLIRVYNSSGAQINNGSVVHISGSTNGLPLAILANASKQDRTTVSGVATHNIPNNSEGFITNFGVVKNVNLSAFNSGDEVYLSDTVDGGLTDTGASNINLTSRVNFVGWVITSGVTGKLLVKIQNEDETQSLTSKERNVLIGNTTSNGVFLFSGMTLTTPVSGTTFNVGPAKGWLVDNTSNPNNPTVQLIEYSGGTGLTSPYLNTDTESYVLLTSAATITVLNQFPTPQQRRLNIYLGKLGHPNKSTFNNVFNEPDYENSPLSQLRDIFTPIRIINAGVIPSAAGASLQFKITSGTLYGLGINYINDVLNPNTLAIPASNPTTFQYRTQTGGTATNFTLVDPTLYDLNGVATAIGGGSNTSTNQRIYLLQNGQVRIQYGQVTHSSLSAAVAAIPSENFTIFPNWRDNAILIGVISVTRTATDLSDSNQAIFTLPSKFGDINAASGGGTSTTTLQQAYNNSTQPEILTNSTLGAVTFRRGSTSESDSVIEVQNNSGVNTFRVNGLGDVSGNSFNIKTYIYDSLNTSGVTNQVLFTSPSGVRWNNIDSIVTGYTNNKVIELGSGVGSTVRINNGNISSGNYSGILSGTGNTASGVYSFIGGGVSNIITGSTSAIVSGLDNEIYTDYSFIGSGTGNTITSIGSYSVIGGGRFNRTSGVCSFIGGGCGNTMSGSYNVITGGRANTTSNIASNIAGGNSNISSGGYSAVGGGRNNCATGTNSVIAGGAQNTLSGSYTVIGGGCQNRIAGNIYSYIGSGNFNTITGGTSSAILSGSGNTVSLGNHSIINGGLSNSILSNCSVVGGGCRNTNSGNYSTIGGGIINTITSQCSFIGGGRFNVISNASSVITGGYNNTSSGQYSVISGGYINLATANYSTISGGYCNTNSGGCASIGGGRNNTIGIVSTSNFSFIGGGINNRVLSACSFIGSGQNNLITGTTSNIVGGTGNTITSNFSYIAGGQRNTTSCNNTFIFGSNITANAVDTTFTQCINACGQTLLQGTSASSGCALLVRNSTPLALYTTLNTGQHIFNGTFTATANNTCGWNLNQTLRQRSTDSDLLYATFINPTIISTQNNQVNKALSVQALFTGSSITLTGATNIIADFSATNVGTQLSITDVTTGVIYGVNDISGLPIIDATSNWDVNIYDFPNTVLSKTGKTLTFGVIRNTASTVTVQSDLVFNEGLGLNYRMSQVTGVTTGSSTSILYQLPINTGQTIFLTTNTLGKANNSNMDSTLGEIKFTAKRSLTGSLTQVGVSQGFVNRDNANTNIGIDISSNNIRLVVTGNTDTYLWSSTIIAQTY